MNIAEMIEQKVSGADFGQPSARKTGRDPRWPYVPVIAHPATPSAPKPWQQQVLGKAYATRQEALAAAESHITAQRSALAHKLAEPRMRALREHYGLPTELEI